MSRHDNLCQCNICYARKFLGISSEPEAPASSREWYLGPAAWAPKGRLIAYEKDQQQVAQVIVHRVIEYSAYAALEAKLEDQSKTYKMMDAHSTQMQNLAHSRTCERDTLKAKLVKAKTALELISGQKFDRTYDGCARSDAKISIAREALKELE